MDKVIFVVFDGQDQACEGDRALRQMHGDGVITLYKDAVVVREPDGKVTVRAQPDTERVGALGGLIMGSLIGVPGGPVGVALGAGTGTVVGAAFEATRAGMDRDFVTDVGTHLAPGKAALIAEVDENWEVPLDVRMEGIGGTVLRRARTQLDDACLEEAIDAYQKELMSLEAEKVAALKAAETEKARQQVDRLQAKIDAARRNVQEQEDALVAKMRSVNQEGRERNAVLEAQKATATEESQALLERRLADVRRQYEQRMQRLNEAFERRKAGGETAAV